MKSEYLMLAHTFKNQYVGGWFVSEKLDGTRAFWDGGVSRGTPAAEVPYANTVKDHRLLTPPVATGLWSRSGKVIYAPNDWLDQLPEMPLDGELWISRGEFQVLRRIIAEHEPSPAWRFVKFMVFDSPNWDVFTRTREIKIRSQYEFWVHRPRIHEQSFSSQWDYHRKIPEFSVPSSWNFEHVNQCLLSRLKSNCYRAIIPMSQTTLPLRQEEAIVFLECMLDDCTLEGGEGLMLRNPVSKWVPERSHNLLKVKPQEDAEGKIIGFTSGRETERGSKLLGKIGALILDYRGKRLELSGLTHEEREFAAPWMREIAANHPGIDMTGRFQGKDFEGKHFKVGQIVSFKYNGLTEDGIPKEARYWRKP